VLALFLASPRADISIAAISAALFLPMRACVRILRGFEAVGLVEGTPAGFRARRRSSARL
jgi:hypothetical protein